MANENYRLCFIVVSLLGFICCLDRADYNLPLGIFAFILWNQVQFQQKHRILWITIISIIADIMWVLIVSVAIWNNQDRQGNSMRGITQIVSIVNIVFKIIIVLYAILGIQNCKDLFSCQGISRKTLYF